MADEIYAKSGVTFSTLMHLDAIGLIRFDGFAGFQRTGLPQHFIALYHQTPIAFSLPKETYNLETGKVLLTQEGKQLAKICSPAPVEGFIEYVANIWAGQDVSTSSPYPKLTVK